MGPTVTTLNEMLAMVVTRNARKIAVLDDTTTVSYDSLEERIRMLAARLGKLGVRKGDPVALLFPNSLDFVTTFFSIIRLGAVAVPLNSQYQLNDILYVLNACGVSVLVTSSELAPLCQTSLLNYDRPCELLLIDDHQFSEVQPAFLENLDIGIDPGAPVLYQFSSGSTGRPKRVARTHANLLFELNGLIDTLQLRQEDRIIGVAPFSHVNGLMRSMLASVGAGATLYPLPRFERRAVADMIEKHGISILIGVPFMFGTLAKTNFQRRPDFSSLRLCVSASAPLPAELNRRFQERFGIYVRQLYGSTETGSVSVNLSADIDKTMESVGKPIGGIEVEVFTENGEPALANEIGEVAVKSPAAIESYDGDDELNKESFRGGYFMTGDLGRRNEDGLLYLVGRKKLFINKGGYKINPQEIELLLATHPKVEEAVVVGLPTPYGDEKVKAVIVLNAPCTEEEIIEHCRGKTADFKIPSLIEFRDEIPKTSTGKIRRENLV